jgi:hypothetical protein
MGRACRAVSAACAMTGGSTLSGGRAWRPLPVQAATYRPVPPFERSGVRKQPRRLLSHPGLEMREAGASNSTLTLCCGRGIYNITAPMSLELPSARWTTSPPRARKRSTANPLVVAGGAASAPLNHPCSRGPMRATGRSMNSGFGRTATSCWQRTTERCARRPGSLRL